MDDRWVKNQALIKILYQDERKTLTEVKQILERDHHFPDQPITIYETHIRDVLRLRKRLKKGDYAIIHRFALSRGWEKYDVYLNGTLIPWIKYWKEYRRSGARDQKGTVASTADSLPPGVAIKGRVAISHPPTSCTSPILQPSDESEEPTVDPEQTLILYSPERRIAEPPSVPPVATIQGSIKSSQDTAESEETIVRHRPQGNSDTTVPSHGLYCHNSMDNTRVPLRGDWLSLLSPDVCPVSINGGANIKAALTQITLHGLNSNHVIEEDIVLLSQAMQSSPQADVVELFKTYSLILRDIWNQFMWSPILNLSVHGRSRAGVKVDFALYITITLSYHPEWMIGHEDKLLLIASSVGERGLVSRLLDMGARPSMLCANGQSSIISALQAEAYDCVELQVQSCSINKDNVQVAVSGGGGLNTELTTSTFVLFLDYAMECFRNAQAASQRWKADGLCHRQSIIAALAIFLKNGADVDAPYPPALGFGSEYDGYSDDYLHRPPSCLEVVFYGCRALYEQMNGFSRVISLHTHRIINRIEVCNAAERGREHLASYLNRNGIYGNAGKQGFLQMVLFEVAFIRAEFFEDSKTETAGSSNGIVVKTLMEYGVTLPSAPSRLLGAKLTSVDMAAEAFSFLLSRSKDRKRSGSVLSSLRHLFRLSGALCPVILQESVEGEGTAMLSALAECNGHFSSTVREHGGCAVVMAALLGNYDAISMLLQHGFDVNSDFSVPEFGSLSRPRTAVGHILFWAPAKEWSLPTRLAAVKCLVKHGARVRLRQSDRTCFELLAEFILEEPRNIFDFFQFSEDHFPFECSLVVHWHWQWMRGCLSSNGARSIPEPDDTILQIFETFFDNDPYLSSGVEILAAIILWGGRPELIQRLIAEGADVNAVYSVTSQLGIKCYSPLRAAVLALDVDLAIQLLHLGARMEEDILAVAVSIAAPMCEDASKKKAMITSLVDKGAKLNGRGSDGLSPLQHCARNGNVNHAAFLLERGADPDAVRALPHTWHPDPDNRKTPLDLAAEFGRLDMCRLFLMAGGLSARLGATGYDGAIERAQKKEFTAIVQLIRTHVSAISV